MIEHLINLTIHLSGPRPMRSLSVAVDRESAQAIEQAMPSEHKPGYATKKWYWGWVWVKTGRE